jgi:LPS-assembly protein
MKKILLILGVLLTLANNASLSGASQAIPPESNNIISSPHKKGDEESETLERMFALNTPDDSSEWHWASGKPVLKRMFDPKALEPEWYWANGKPAIKPPLNSEFFDIIFGPNALEPEWYWANGKPLTKTPKKDEVWDSLLGPNTLGASPEWYWANGKPAIKPPKNDEVFIIADHVRHDVKKEIMWVWGKVKIRMENQTIQADKVKLKNNTGEGEARGHVIIKSIDGTKLKAKFSRFNIKNKKGKFLQTRGRLGKRYYIKSRELIRHSQKRYTAKSGSLTTCTGKLPDWLFEAEWMDLINDDRAVFTGGILKVRNIPVLYIPAGYLPLNQERKSGFLLPAYGNSDIGGFRLDNQYYWAINGHSDATFGLGYQGKRGFSPSIEYRYLPRLGTNGNLTGTLVDDKITKETYWKLDSTYNSDDLLKGWTFNGVLDLEGKEYNKTFTDDINLRNRRISNSFAALRKSWESHSFEILTRYRNSTDIASDQTLGELPQITYKSQRQKIGDSKFYFNQDTVFSSFLTDLNSDPSVDNYFSVQRLHFHPQLTRSINIAPWLNFAATIGLQETIYTKGQNNTAFFSREALDLQTTIKGPTFEKVFQTRNKLIPKIKHLLEPRLSFDYIPDLDNDDRDKIKSFDYIDVISPKSVLSYSLIQRILQKEVNGNGSLGTREALRFIISQSYDFREASRVGTAASPSRPFSDIRFDLDSRLVDPLLLNFDSTYDINDKVLKTFNFQVGFRPTNEFTAYLERRWTRRGDISTVATLDWDFLKGWNLKASTRLDEITRTHRENNLSLLYDDPCECWAFNVDYIHRNNFNSTSNTSAGGIETKWLFSLTFRGLGSIKSKANEKFIHRSFEPLYPSEEYQRRKKEEQRRRGQ